ncbi:MAG: TIGR04086 family membrane protein [[Bacteroides] pectinophilus]|nr:TIGR04086 family membrane protein [[Bacteroides] pectinophilus]
MKDNAIRIVKAVVASYVASFVFILIIALMMYRLKLSENQVRIGIMAVYFLSAAIGGFLLSKSMGKRRLIMGLSAGLIYFIVLTLMSFVINKSIDRDAAEIIKALAACSIGGVIGGIAG